MLNIPSGSLFSPFEVGFNLAVRGSLNTGWLVIAQPIQRVEHLGIVVDDLAAAIGFFVELGLELQGEGLVEGRWVDRVVGLEGVRADIAMLQTPDGHGRLELTKFHTPSSQGGDRDAPANTPGIRHIAFAVEDIDNIVARLRAQGFGLVGELERYEDSYRLCYVRGGPRGSSSSWRSVSVEAAHRLSALAMLAFQQLPSFTANWPTIAAALAPVSAAEYAWIVIRRGSEPIATVAPGR